MEMPKPTAQHEWLKRMIGEWTFDGGGESPEGEHSFGGKETVRAIGDVWIIGESVGAMGGIESHMVVTLGYDPVKARFVGTWVGSMMANLWVYDGEMDESGNAVNLYAEGPAFDGSGRIDVYRDRMELRSDDHRVLTSAVRNEDGSWKQFMEMHFRRA
jgi:hypothetical protein